MTYCDGRQYINDDNTIWWWCFDQNQMYPGSAYMQELDTCPGCRRLIDQDDASWQDYLDRWSTTNFIVSGMKIAVYVDEGGDVQLAQRPEKDDVDHLIALLDVAIARHDEKQRMMDEPDWQVSPFYILGVQEPEGF